MNAGPFTNMTIAELIDAEVPEVAAWADETRAEPAPTTISWLREALQAAAEIELATIPPYLCAYWTIRDATVPDAQDAARTLRDIAVGEMFHLASVCNLLVGVGAIPVLAARAPKYPGPLPRGVRPELTVGLGRLTKHRVEKTFMDIETPETSGQHTIGAFYTLVQRRFNEVRPALSTTRQLSVSFGTRTLRKAANYTEAVAMIETVKEEGEGTGTNPHAPDGTLAHYWRFGELFHGRRYVQSGGRWGYTGPAVPFPADANVYPMRDVPVGGWGSSAPLGVKQVNVKYLEVLSALENAWRSEGPAQRAEYDRSVAAMKDLYDLARDLMTVPINGGPEVYGPDFRVT